MNLYIRYFEKEVLVSTIDEALAFLSDIDDIEMTQALEGEIRAYVSSDVYYPKRYKVRQRVYFIMIKTEAATMADFKAKKAVHSAPQQEGRERHATASPAHLGELRFGWYEGSVDFKRVLMVPGTNKFQYKDAHFVARCKAESGLDCYNRIIDHLSQRVDRRSQFPSAKGKNFKFAYLGACK